MPLPTQKISKAQAFRRYMANPQAEGFRMLWDMQESIPDLVAAAVKQIEEGARETVSTEALEVLKQLIETGLPTMVTANIKGLVGDLKAGLDGKNPVAGKDYFTQSDKREIVRAVLKFIKLPTVIHGKPGAKGDIGKSPKAGVDFPTRTEFRSMISSMLGQTMAKKKTQQISPKEVATMTKKMIAKINLTERAAEIARALETLKGNEAFDYYALKNRPGVKAYDEKDTPVARRMLRGGSGSGSSAKDPLYYDLSDELDGVTKVFNIPTAKRVLGVWGTQFPGGGFRPGVDWTATNTQLTLTAEVGAPEDGQTLYILYTPL